MPLRWEQCLVSALYTSSPLMARCSAQSSRLTYRAGFGNDSPEFRSWSRRDRVVVHLYRRRSRTFDRHRAVDAGRSFARRCSQIPGHGSSAPNCRLCPAAGNSGNYRGLYFPSTHQSLHQDRNRRAHRNCVVFVSFAGRERSSCRVTNDLVWL